MQTNAATNISANHATLNGYLYNTNGYNYNNNYNGNNNYNNNYQNTSYGVWFQYGTTQSYGNESNHQVSNYAGSFNQNIANIQPNTLYHFRAAAQDNYGSISYGQDMTFQTVGGQNSISLIKTVRNLSSGNLGWQNSVTAKPGDVLNFMITMQASSGQNVNNVTVRDILPGNLINRTNLALDNVQNYGDLNSGINIGYLSPGQTRTLSYQVQVAPAANFSFGTTTLTNSVTVSSSDLGGNLLPASASVIVNRTAVLGATSVSTGLTNNFWADSFFLPLLLAGLGLWAYKSGLLGIDEWIARRKNKTKDFRAGKKLENKIAQIKGKESGWPTL